MKVYLAGPIANMTDEQTHDWRETATALLSQDKIETIDPAKLRDFRGVPYPGDLAVVEPDKRDIDASDVLLAYTHTPSVGTSMEVLYAWERGKFVVIVHPDPEHASPWLHYHSHAFERSLAVALWEITEYSRMSFAERVRTLEADRPLGHSMPLLRSNFTRSPVSLLESSS